MRKSMGQDFMEVTYDKFTFRVVKGYLYHFRGVLGKHDKRWNSPALSRK